MDRYSLRTAIPHRDTEETPRCFFDVIRDLSLEFDIPEAMDAERINKCQLTRCSGRESKRSCYRACTYDPEALKLDFKTALLADERKQRRKRNGEATAPLTPRTFRFSDDHMAQLCGNTAVDRFFTNQHYRGIDRIDTLEDEDN